MQKTEKLNEFKPLIMIPLQSIINILESKRLLFIISFIALCFSDVKDNQFLILLEVFFSLIFNRPYI